MLYGIAYNLYFISYFMVFVCIVIHQCFNLDGNTSKIEDSKIPESKVEL